MPKSLFDFENYVEFLKVWIEFQKSKGEAYAIKSKLARAMKISSTMMSLILNEQKLMSREQASELVEFLGLTELESDYFFIMVEIAHAGTESLRRRLKNKKSKLRLQAQKVGSRVRKDRELSEETKSIFYSNWMYSGISLMTAIPKYQDSHSIAKKLNLPVNLVTQMLEFLLEHGLCRLHEGKIIYGSQSTHLDADSPLVNKYHQNWRLKGLQVMESRQASNLFFTGPVVLSPETAEQVKGMLLDSIESLMKKISPSPSEVPYCLNIDWFDYSGGDYKP